MRKTTTSNLPHAGLIISLILVSILGIVFWTISSIIAATGDPEYLQQRGLVGDSFGAVNAAFSGFTLIIVLLSLRESRAREQGAEEQRAVSDHASMVVHMLNARATMASECNKSHFLAMISGEPFHKLVTSGIIYADSHPRLENWVPAGRGYFDQMISGQSGDIHRYFELYNSVGITLDSIRFDSAKDAIIGLLSAQLTTAEFDILSIYSIFYPKPGLKKVRQELIKKLGMPRVAQLEYGVHLRGILE